MTEIEKHFGDVIDLGEDDGVVMLICKRSTGWEVFWLDENDDEDGWSPGSGYVDSLTLGDVLT